MAFQLNSNVYDKQRSMQDYMREDETYNMNKKASQQSLESNEMAMKQQKIKGAMDILSSAVDEESYQRAKVLGQQMGFDVSNMPDRFDPTVISGYQRVLQNAMGKQGGETERLIDRYMQENNVDFKDAFDAVKGKNMSPYQEQMIDLKEREFERKEKPKPLPASVIKEQNTLLDNIGMAKAIESDLNAFKQKISSGQLNLGAITNVQSKAKNMLGVSDQNSRNYQSFRSQLEKMRNDSLRLNNGVQTEGDAQRAWQELISNINDEEVVVQRLDEISRINKRAAALKELQVDEMRNNFGAEPMDFEPYSMPAYTQATEPQGLDMSDPRVQQAKQAGYSDEEIANYLRGK